MSDNKTVGEIIKRERIEKHITQAELGSLVGVSQQSIDNWEKGRSSIQLKYLKKLCEVLGRSSDYLLFGEEPSLSYELSRLLESKKDKIERLSDIALFNLSNPSVIDCLNLMGESPYCLLFFQHLYALFKIATMENDYEVNVYNAYAYNYKEQGLSFISGNQEDAYVPLSELCKQEMVRKMLEDIQNMVTSISNNRAK